MCTLLLKYILLRSPLEKGKWEISVLLWLKARKLPDTDKNPRRVTFCFSNSHHSFSISILTLRPWTSTMMVFGPYPKTLVLRKFPSTKAISFLPSTTTASPSSVTNPCFHFHPSHLWGPLYLNYWFTFQLSSCSFSHLLFISGCFSDGSFRLYISLWSFFFLPVAFLQKIQMEKARIVDFTPLPRVVWLHKFV